MPVSRPPQSVALAALWMMGAVASLIGIALAGRELTRELSVFEVVFIRNAFCLLVLVPYMSFAHENRWRTDRVRGHLLRNTVHFTAQAAWFYGLMRLPLGEVTALEFTAPIWTAVLAALLLDLRDAVEHQHRRERQLRVAGAEQFAPRACQKVLVIEP